MVNSPFGKSLNSAGPGGIRVDNVVSQRAIQEWNGI